VAVSGDAPPVGPAPGADDVRRITAIANPALRNLEITHCYSLLSAAFAARSGSGANWCTYATWASRQAGRTIRGEDLGDRLGRRLRHGSWLRHPIRTWWRRLLRLGLLDPESRIGRLTAELHTPFDAFEVAADAVARGNRKVFAEIGLEFARYLDGCPPGNAARLERFLGRLQPGEPPEGQRLLRLAFSRYHRLHEVPEEGTRMELAVLANLEIGLHEQTRLQPEIRAGLDAAYATKEDLGRRALTALFPSTVRWWPIAGRPAAAAVGVLAVGLQRASSKLAREVITESFLTLSLPGRVLELGTHLPDEYPGPLHQPAEAELVAFLEQVEPAPPATDDCGARDWSELQQRMHYIAHLFRAFHQRDELGEPPFRAEQVAAFRRGVVPDGEL
jgi:hypothetical protein